MTATEPQQSKTAEEIVRQLRDVLRDETDNGNFLNDGALASLLAGVHPADIAEILERLGDEGALRVFRVLDDTRAAETLDELDSDTTEYLLDHEVAGRITTLLDILPMDDAAEILEESASPERQKEILDELAERSPEDAAEVRELLSYPPKSAGRLMTDAFVRLRPEMSVDEAFAAIRHSDPEVETLNDLYVVEPRLGSVGEEKLVGVLSLRDLVRAHPQARLRAIMVGESRIVSVTTKTDQEEVARLISRYDFLALPVLDDKSNLAGIVTVDDVVDILLEEQTEDILRQASISPSDDVVTQSYFNVPVWRVVRSRVGWLMILFVAAAFTAGVLKQFQTQLEAVTALTLFIPLIIGTGGNTGAQTVSTIIRGMALGEVGFRDTWRVLLREAASGFLLGLLLAVFAFLFARFLMQESVIISIVVGLTILAACAWANIIGALIPLLAQKLKLDPALVSSPFITTIVDATGLAIYLLIARALIIKLH